MSHTFPATKISIVSPISLTHQQYSPAAIYYSHICNVNNYTNGRGDYKDPQCDSVLDASEHEDYTLTRTCSKLVGKFVTVDYYHPRKPLRPLTLCEVQIYAHGKSFNLSGLALF